MTFEVAADAYGRFMGRYSEPLAVQFADLVAARPGQRALDVGCGTGALTAVLVQRLGVEAVIAVDPSVAFLSAVRERLPGVDVRSAVAEQLPFLDGEFDLSLAQLVVHFMTDPVSGLAEMGRVTRPGGLVAACVWDHAGGAGPLFTFWEAVRQTDPTAHDEADLPGAREGHLAQLCEAAGLHNVESSMLTVDVPFATLDDWWEPFTFGVGPAGEYVAGLDEPRRAELRAECERRLPHPPFEVRAVAWCVTAQA